MIRKAEVCRKKSQTVCQEKERNLTLVKQFEREHDREPFNLHEIFIGGQMQRVYGKHLKTLRKRCSLKRSLKICVRFT
jgi:hypothetical protein